MYHSTHSLFDSAWPESVAWAVASLVILWLLLRRSPWAVVPWLSVALVAFSCTFGLGAILLLLLSYPHRTGDMFPPLMFAGPFVLALIVGLPVCYVVWLTRPTFGTLKGRHWAVAIMSLPAAILLILNAPKLYNTQAVIQCRRVDGTPPLTLSLQRMEDNEVVTVGTPVTADVSGCFRLCLNKRESFTAIITSPGYQPQKIGFWPHPKKGFWMFFLNQNAPRELPLGSPGTLTVTMTEAPTNALQRTAQGGGR